MVRGWEWKDMNEYCEAKNDVLAWILERAGYEGGGGGGD